MQAAKPLDRAEEYDDRPQLGEGKKILYKILRFQDILKLTTSIVGTYINYITLREWYVSKNVIYAWTRLKVSLSFHEAECVHQWHLTVGQNNYQYATFDIYAINKWFQQYWG